MAKKNPVIRIGQRTSAVARKVPLQRRGQSRPHLRASQVNSYCARCATPVDRGGS